MIIMKNYKESDYIYTYNKDYDFNLDMFSSSKKLPTREEYRKSKSQVKEEKERILDKEWLKGAICGILTTFIMTGIMILIALVEAM